MSLLLETLRYEQGQFHLLNYHDQRFARARKQLFHAGNDLKLSHYLTTHCKPPADEKKYKCRVTYNKQIKSVEFVAYQPKPVKSLKFIEANELAYNHKFANRQSIEKLYAQKDDCDDILIVQNGWITDTSYSNVVFLGKDGCWYTPETYLLNGVKRQYYLDEGLVQTLPISPQRLDNFVGAKRINALLDISDTALITRFEC